MFLPVSHLVNPLNPLRHAYLKRTIPNGMHVPPIKQGDGLHDSGGVSSLGFGEGKWKFILHHLANNRSSVIVSFSIIDGAEGNMNSYKLFNNIIPEYSLILELYL